WQVFVERGEIGESSGRTSQPIDPLLRRLVAGLLGEGAAQGHERRVDVPARVLEQERDLVKKVDLASRVVSPLDLDLVNADELLPVAARPIQRLEDLRDRERVLGNRAEPLERSERG